MAARKKLTLKEALKALRLSEERFALATAAGNALWDWDVKAGRAYRSGALQGLIGLPNVDVIADPADWLARIHPDDLAPYKAAFRDYFKGKADRIDCEYRIRVAAGEYRWLRDLATGQRTRSGRMRRLSGTTHDITNHKRAQFAARESEARFRDFAEATSDWQWETDAALRFSHISDRFQEATGVDPKGLIGQTRWEAVNADTKRDQNWRRHRDEMLAHRPFRDFRHLVVTGDGKRRYIRVSGNPVFDAAGAFRGYRGGGSDETPEVEARLRAESAEAILIDAIENIPQAFVFYDADDRLVICNSRYRELYPTGKHVPGARFEDIVRESAERGLQLDAVGRVEEWVAERIRLHRVQTGPSEQRLKDGRWLLVEERRVSSGGVVGLRTDITRLKQTETELRAALNQAQEADRAKSEFLANMSHELRTPLNAIIGFSEIMHSELFGPIERREYKDYVAHIYDSGRHLLTVINDILDFSKMQAGHMALHEEIVDLAATVALSVNTVRPQADKGKLAVVVDVHPALSLKADEAMVKRILINLLSNAVKFTPAGGEVAIHAVREPDGTVAIRVRDTGIGMRREDIPLAMEPFRQVDSELSRKFSGTGLGLPLTKRMVEIHGGTIGIESTYGAGTLVTVRFPPERVPVDRMRGIV